MLKVDTDITQFNDPKLVAVHRYIDEPPSVVLDCVCEVCGFEIVATVGQMGRCPQCGEHEWNNSFRSL